MTANRTQAEPDEVYYGGVRQGIFPFLPDHMEKVLEIGGGLGHTLAAIKKKWDVPFAASVEIDPDCAELAREKLDLVITGNIETIELPFEHDTFDVILCLDVLEHLADPWSIVQRLTRYLKPGGCLISSLPNVRHFSASLPLLFRGRWTLRDEGILDRTHLRFFVRNTAIELMECSGLKIEAIEEAGMPVGSRPRLVNILTFGLFRSFLVSQYLIKAVKKGENNSASQGV